MKKIISIGTILILGFILANCDIDLGFRSITDSNGSENSNNSGNGNSSGNTSANMFIGEWTCDDEPLYEIKFTENEFFFLVDGQAWQKGVYKHSGNNFTATAEHLWTGTAWRDWDIATDGHNTITGQVIGNKLFFSGDSNNVYTRKGSVNHNSNPFIGEWTCDDEPLYEIRFTENEFFFLVDGQAWQKGVYEHSGNNFTATAEYWWTGTAWRDWDVTSDEGNNIVTGQVIPITYIQGEVNFSKG
jgi:hypothetical protein